MASETKTKPRKIVRMLPIAIDGVWAAEDFSRFLDAVNAIYLYCVLGSSQARRQTDKYARLLENPDGTFHYVFEGGRTLDGVLPPTELWKALQSKRAELILMAEEIRDFAMEYGAIEWRQFGLQPTLGVRVRSIHYGSLGEANMKGLGEPLEQCRELLKDLTYRNRLEREVLQVAADRSREAAQSQSELEQLDIEQKRLEVLHQKLDILRELGLPNDVLARAVLSTEHLETIRELKARRLIREIGEVRDE